MVGWLSGQLVDCQSCPRRCRVNRLAGELGFCRVGAGIPVAHSGLHFGEEPPISGHRGSGTIFFAGCNLRCLFCQNYQISQEFTLARLPQLTVAQLAAEMLRLEGAGAHNINFVSPSHLLLPMADAIRSARDQGLSVPVVYNSNAYDEPAALRQVRGLIDIYLPDLKYLDNSLARRWSAVADYAETALAALREMLEQVGHLQVDAAGIARRGLLVRHLVLPGALADSRRCLAALAELSADIHVSIMAQYSPCYRAAGDPLLNRTLRAAEYEEIVDWALALGLENAYVQELESQNHYLPDFDRNQPFA